MKLGTKRSLLFPIMSVSSRVSTSKILAIESESKILNLEVSKRLLPKKARTVDEDVIEQNILSSNVEIEASWPETGP